MMNFALVDSIVCVFNVSGLFVNGVCLGIVGRGGMKLIYGIIVVEKKGKQEKEGKVR